MTGTLQSLREICTVIESSRITKRAHRARPAKKLSGTARQERDPLQWAYRTILVYPNLGEQNRIAKGFKHRPEEPCGSARAVVKQHVKSVSLTGARAHNTMCDRGTARRAPGP